MGEFQVEHGVLRAAGERMVALVGAEGSASLADLSADGQACGDAAFAAAFAGFCERWGAGVDALREGVRTMGGELAREADAHRSADEQGGAALSAPASPGRAAE